MRPVRLGMEGQIVARNHDSLCFRDEAERRANVAQMAQEIHPDSPLMASLLLAWSDAEASANTQGLIPARQIQADGRARDRMDEYVRVKALPLCWAGWRAGGPQG